MLPSRSAEQTQAIGARFAAIAQHGDLVILTGDLGAGKTCFTQGVGRAMGVTDPITSPTFTLANRYEAGIGLNHLDVYRLDDVAETLDLDLPELLDSGLTIIEWGEQIAPVLGADGLIIRIVFGEGDDDRALHFESASPQWVTRLRGFEPETQGDINE